MEFGRGGLFGNLFHKEYNVNPLTRVLCFWFCCAIMSLGNHIIGRDSSLSDVQVGAAVVIALGIR